MGVEISGRRVYHTTTTMREGEREGERDKRERVREKGGERARE